MVYISFHVFRTIGLKAVFEVEICRVIQYTKYNIRVDAISCPYKNISVSYNTFDAVP